jgi:hypothetical protein
MDTVLIMSRRYGQRKFEKVRVEPYQRKTDGAQSALAIWRGSCVICGQPYEVKTPGHPLADLRRTSAFGVVTCLEHRRQRIDTRSI